SHCVSGDRRRLIDRDQQRRGELLCAEHVQRAQQDRAERPSTFSISRPFSCLYSWREGTRVRAERWGSKRELLPQTPLTHSSRILARFGGLSFFGEVGTSK